MKNIINYFKRIRLHNKIMKLRYELSDLGFYYYKSGCNVDAYYDKIISLDSKIQSLNKEYMSLK